MDCIEDERSSPSSAVHKIVPVVAGQETIADDLKEPESLLLGHVTMRNRSVEWG